MSVPNPRPAIEGDASEYFAPEVAELCAREIHEAGGVEVFFIARLNGQGIIVEAESHAYGHASSVPAIMNLVRPGEVFIHNHPSGYLMPSDADIAVASQLGNMGVGCYIIDNACARCRIVVRPQEPRRKTMVEEGDVLRRLQPGGSVSRTISGYEDRPQQREMARSVCNALNFDGISVIEAGTGTGKSFAYLVPAVMYALKNQERVVISTATITLQEQLLHKDIPAVRKALGEEVEVEIVKGRGNYVCRRKASFAATEASTLIEDDYIKELQELLRWIETTPTGDRSELPEQPRPNVWERVQSESDNCLRVRCPYYESCFFYNSRRRAARAKLLIVNHSLLMSDLAVRRASGNWSVAAVLPPYTRLVIDEAHHLEDAATNNLAQTVSRFGVRQLFSRLHRKDSARGRGVLSTLNAELDEAILRNQIDVADDRVQRFLHYLLPRVNDVRDSVDYLLDDFGQHFLRLIQTSTLRPGETERRRLKDDILRDPVWNEECVTLLNEFAAELNVFVTEHRAMIERFEDFDEKITNRILNPYLEWQAIIGRIDEVRKTVLLFLADSIDYCRWVEIYQPAGNGRAPIIRLCLAPVDVSSLLRESLHDRMKSEVLTSATLAVDQRFDFFNERSGLPYIREKPPEEFDEEGNPVIHRDAEEARPIETHILGSPFDYDRQVYFGVPTDMPDPRDQNFDDALVNLIKDAIRVTGGRAFVLFTSYSQLNRVYSRTEFEIRKMGIEPLRQGKISRDRLLAQFREDETSVLFATSSFWEGVDVKGRALELLIIAKLPFAVPNEPIQEAQYEALQAQGRDPFDNLVVPRAVIRFKQGFGRLIRSRTDRGAVLIADRRVIKMRYGRRFLHSLPPVALRQGAARDVVQDMRRFFREKPPEESSSEDEVPF